MNRNKARNRAAIVGMAVLAAGCSGPYEDPGTSGYLLGTIFVLVGVVIGIALILSLN